jgi:hypothetical protein
VSFRITKAESPFISSVFKFLPPPSITHFPPSLSIFLSLSFISLYHFHWQTHHHKKKCSYLISRSL